MKSVSDTWPLYFPEMLHINDRKSKVGIVTLWSKKEIYMKRIDPTLYCVMGQLYSRVEGLSAMVRNLLANKNIRDIVIVGTDMNHCADALLALFANGVNEKNEVLGCDHYSKLDNEIPHEAIDEVRKYVRLHDLRGLKSDNELNTKLVEINRKNIEEDLKTSSGYGEFEVFKNPELKLPDTFPSDHVGFKSSGKYISDVWIDILAKINKFGILKKTQYGDMQKELIMMISVITDEDPDNPKWSEYFDFTKEELKEYIPQVTTPNEITGLDYTYGQKLMKFRNIDQIANIISELKKENYTRRAVACTWDVLKDYNNPKCPCLNLVQAIVQDDNLYFTCYFRSNDMFGAWPRNAFALRKLQKNIAEAIGIKMGSLIIISNSGHIYERALNKVSEILSKPAKSREFTQDKYGSFVITIDADAIIATHIDENGKILDKIMGNTAVEVYSKIASEFKISDIGHAMDIGCELQKAEIAKDNRLVYAQDRPLRIK